MREVEVILNELLVDVMVVVGNEKLTIEMQKMFTKNGVTVISAPKSGGVSVFRRNMTHVLTEFPGGRARRAIPQQNQEPTNESLLLRRTAAAVDP